MSRAFVRESDHDAEPLPERVISPHPNFVTRAGLTQIEERVRALETERSAARRESDQSALARIERDLRYWTQRRSTARLIEPAASPDAVRFGVKVTLEVDDGSRREFRLVGEDEADPSRGLVSWVSPLGEALMGARAGDTIRFQEHDAEIVRVET